MADGREASIIVFCSYDAFVRLVQSIETVFIWFKLHSFIFVKEVNLSFFKFEETIVTVVIIVVIIIVVVVIVVMVVVTVIV